MYKRVIFAFALLCLTSATWAAGINNVHVDGNTVTADLDVAGQYHADLTLTFEHAVGLNAANLGLSAELVSPTDASILSRLPDPSAVSLPGAFPVRLRIEPPATGGLSFSGLMQVELYTHNLLYSPASPLRLYSASNGSAFHDITASMSSGSYRVRGGKGQFSELLIVADTRSVQTVIAAKFARAQALLDNNSGLLGGNAYTTLSNQLAAARSSYDNGDLVAAIEKIEAFNNTVQALSGGEIPEVWRSSGDLVNLAGLLRSAAGTLRFSLNWASNNLP